LHNLSECGINLSYWDLDKIPKKTIEKMLLIAQDTINDQNKYLGKMDEQIRRAKSIGGR